MTHNISSTEQAILHAAESESIKEGILIGCGLLATSAMLQITVGPINWGFTFLTFGMLFGALWAKEAWGHYWSWDPKETWAAATWLTYLVYIHFRLARPSQICTALWMLIAAFVLLQMCWWGINYLTSVQTYS